MCGITEENYDECFDWFRTDREEKHRTKEEYIKWIKSFATILDEDIFRNVIVWVFDDNCPEFRHSKFVDGVDILHFYGAIEPIKE